MAIALKNLYMKTDAESKHFQTYIRTYNNLFAFTSLGVTYDRDLAKENRGIYTFKVQGQMHHLIDSLHEIIVIKLMNILRDNPFLNVSPISSKHTELVKFPHSTKM